LSAADVAAVVSAALFDALDELEHAETPIAAIIAKSDMDRI
jgi:hypothetical protein